MKDTLENYINEYVDDVPDIPMVDADDFLMTPFSKEAVKSAKLYREHLKKTKKCREIIKVNSIEEISKNLFELHLDRHAYSSDSIMLYVSPSYVTENLYSDAEEHYISEKFVRICKYDKNVPSLCLDAKDEMAEILRKISTNDICFVSDLTFLVRRVQRWYEEFGYMISFPSAPCIISASDMYVRGYESENQWLAEETALTKPISYIWGAPGTGKTQIVLANCIISYIDKRKRVYIVGPTNNAIEQVLRAVIKALEEQGRSIDVLQRLGTPTEEFVRQYGRICERYDVQEQIELLKQDIEICEEKKKELQRIGLIISTKETFLDVLKKRNKYLASKKELEIKRESISKPLQISSKELSEKKSEYSIEKNKLSAIIRTRSTLAFRTKCTFSKEFKKQSEEELKNQESKTLLLKQEIQGCTTTVDSLIQEEKQVTDQIKQIDWNIDQCIKEIQNCCALIGEKFTSVSNAENLFNNIHFQTQRETEKSLSAKIEYLQNKIMRIEQTHMADMAQKYVFAFTVDYMFSHFEQLLEQGVVEHIFLDEAAYCPMIKAGVLFAFNAPVTFLGDHMQLPPICEVDSKLLSVPDGSLFLWSQSAIFFSQVFEFDSILNLHKQYLEHQLPASKTLPMVPLLKTYRFGNALARVLNRFVYKCDFCGNEEIQTAIFVLDAPAPMGGREGRENKSEVRAIQQYLKEYQPKDYAVLTPYTQQVNLLRAELKGTDRENILTIHRSQGREWDTVIISVSDGIRNKYFTDTSNPRSNGLEIINTAVSRARKNIVIACDYEQWSALCEKQLISGIISLPSATLIRTI